jgi:hypothetical protein
MIDFEEELKKFHPSLEVEDAEQHIHNTDVIDVVDLMIQLAEASRGYE